MLDEGVKNKDKVSAARY